MAVRTFLKVNVELGSYFLRETTSRGLCDGLVCPSRTSERGGEGACVKEGGGEAGERERERALGLLLRHSPPTSDIEIGRDAAALAAASPTSCAFIPKKFVSVQFFLFIQYRENHFSIGSINLSAHIKV
jgi:hypothetical protein